jgi:hypothetical protein
MTAHRMTHPDNPSHEISVLDAHVERYSSQGWRFVDDEAPDTSATDGDD